jgi:FtsP/CotA-like multicopper oxidase with cupredoxin domain
MTAKPVSRRQAIGYGAAAAGVLAGSVDAAQRAQAARTLGDWLARRRPIELPQPRVLRSAHHELNVRLTTRPGVVDVGAPRLVRTYTYDGVLPSYTWDIDPGDTIRVHLRNRLPHLHMKHMRMDRPHEWTTTNLHTHGLHVSPSGNADNVFLVIPPGHDHDLEVPVPADHTGGMFWYHPHHHGGVTQSLRAGMAGALIVRGDIDRVPEVAAAKEQIMIVQALELGHDYALRDPDPAPPPDGSFFPKDRVLYTVNGVLHPTVHMNPGEIQRWRILNAAQGNFLSLHLRHHEFHVLAWDGLTLRKPEPEEALMLSAGNRAEVLVRAGRPGRYHLVLTPGSSGSPDIPGMPEAGGGQSASPPMGGMPGFPLLKGELDRRTILTVEVAGDERKMSLPSGLPAFDPPILPIARHREFAFTLQEPGGVFMNFGINGVPYDPARAPYRPVLGTAEEWTLHNDFDPKLGQHAHVFHIHTNPFRITRRNGKVLDPPLWRDTYVLTKDPGDTITFQSNFVDYPGRFVEHCHIVSHEDLGMMSEIEIVRP